MRERKRVQTRIKIKENPACKQTQQLTKQQTKMDKHMRSVLQRGSLARNRHIVNNFYESDSNCCFDELQKMNENMKNKNLTLQKQHTQTEKKQTKKETTKKQETTLVLSFTWLISSTIRTTHFIRQEVEDIQILVSDVERFLQPPHPRSNRNSANSVKRSIRVGCSLGIGAEEEDPVDESRSKLRRL